MSEEIKKPIKKPRTIGVIFNELVDSTTEWFKDLIDLQEGLDREGTIIAIRDNKKMRGANAWLLMCSIMIASLGLDLDSPAVIIGAMLISPLMSPILGIGLSVGINDKESLYISLRHFGIAIIIALFTSTLYFALTPLGQGGATGEILARTKPSLLDGLVAVFGGLAGIISSSRKDKSNAVPGVAIATALMPPLCVTGYGFANLLTGEGQVAANWAVSINSFYLFFLNSFFVALATYTIIRLLNFPVKAYLNDQEARRTRWILTFFSLIIIIPSANILYELYQEQKINIKVELFKEKFFGPNNNAPARCINHLVEIGPDSVQVIMELLGETIDENDPKYYNFLRDSLKLKNVALSFFQDRDIGLDQIDLLKVKLTNLDVIANELNKVSKTKTEQERKLERLQFQLDSLKTDTIAFNNITNKVKAIFPQLNSMAFGKAQKTNFSAPREEIPIFIINWDRKKPRYEKTSDEDKLYQFLKLETKFDTLQIISY